MKLFKKLLAAVLAMAMIAALGAGCDTDMSTASHGEESGLEGPHGLKYAKDQTLRVVYSTELTQLNPFGSSGSASDWNGVRHCTEGLLSTDQYDLITPGLAESWTVSDDGTVYTFKLREGLQYVDYQMNPVAEMTAQDFVDVAEYVCDPTSGNTSSTVYEDYILNAKEYLSGEITDFSQVGIKALDKYTLEMTLIGPVPYFTEQCGSYMPTYGPYLQELYDDYGTSNDKVLYIGPYVMTIYEPQYRRVYEKNPYYYDSEQVYIEKVIATFNQEANTIAPEMFMRGETDSANITASLLDQWMENSNTKNIVIPGLPDTVYMYYYGFNFWPQFDEKYEPENWDLAVNNENFRQSLYWALNRQKLVLTVDPYFGENLISNTITAKTWADVDGIDFTQIGDLKAIADRPNHQFEPDKALEYKEKAMQELKAQGVTFPIKVLMPYNPGAAYWELEVQVVSQQLVDVLGEDYVKFYLEAGPTTGFLAAVRRTGDWAFMELNNGGAYHDPQVWTIAFVEGGSWNFPDLATGLETQAIVREYYKLVDEAKGIFTKSMARYEAFAKAEAYWLNHAMVIPVRSDTNGYYVTRLNEFENLGGTYKGQRVLAYPLTSDQFRALYADWQTEREAALLEQAGK